MGLSPQEQIALENKEIFELAAEGRLLYTALLETFNGKHLKLVAMPPHKRIFLFFITRVIKTFSAVCMLCQGGYGQDTAPLLRSMLEILISVKYMLCDSALADQKAVRFVDYKWVIFRRHIPDSGEEPAAGENDSDEYKKLIAEKFKEYKEKYRLTSDRSLMTWSGKSTRDMAKKAGKELLEEYESAFRADSRFSHPSIIGDREYVDYQDEALVFSFAPSSSGLLSALKRAFYYMTEFLSIFERLFDLEGKERVENFQKKTEDLFNTEKYRQSLLNEKSLPGPTKESVQKWSVRFKISASISNPA